MDNENRLPFCDNFDACTGCAACAAVCPGKCIALLPNSEGFLCPAIETERCTNCELCVKTCPVNSQRRSAEQKNSDHVPLGVFAAWHLNEAIRQKSSSGGVFTALAENILPGGGVVVGAAFDENLIVKHILIDSADDLHRLRGSKYVQSEIAPNLYRQIHEFLESGRPVLFSGTPCQVAGLQRFLSKDYDTLFCCDLICYGVPSPLLFERYVRYRSSKNNRLVKVDFRDKTNGWKRFGMRQHNQKGTSSFFSMWADPYLAAFQKKYSLRVSCYACDFKGISRFGDLTVADFWGVAQRYPEYDVDDKGTSLILVNTEKGKAWLDACRPNLFLGSADLDTAVRGNPMLNESCFQPHQRKSFFIDLNNHSFNHIARRYKLCISSTRRVFSSIKNRFLRPQRGG